jgi:tRNA threonylcarbamoyladenosine biosynthesis protein TsaB
MRVLALDTATEACSVALLADSRITREFSEVGRGHADQILAMVDRVLGEAQMSLSMLDGIAACVGPGSFTGVRISVAVAQGLAFGAGLPVVPVTTLEALALRVLGEESPLALACLDARMGEVYSGTFAHSKLAGVEPCAAAEVGKATDLRLPFAARYRGIGRGFAAYPVLAQLPGVVLEPEDRSALPDAREMARLGAIRLAAGEGIDAADLQPRYLRDKVALTEAERALLR